MKQALKREIFPFKIIRNTVNHEKGICMSRTSYVRLIVFALFTLSMAVSSASAADISGVWKHGASGETWTFTATGEGTYRAVEHGFGNARGTAVVIGNRLVLVYATLDRAVTGLYDVTLSADGQSADGKYQDSRPAGGHARLVRAGGSCQVAGVWRNGDGRWTFTPMGNGRFQAQEQGYGNAHGTAVQNGNSVRLNYVTADGRVKGYYDFTLSGDCRRATGVWADSQPASGNVTMDRIQ